MSDKPEIIAKINNKYGDPESFAERELKAVADIQNERIGTELIRLSDHEARTAELHARLAQALSLSEALEEWVAVHLARIAELEAEQDPHQSVWY